MGDILDFPTPVGGVTDQARLHDEVLVACGYGRDIVDELGLYGWGVAELFDGDGKLKQRVPFVNLISDVGDDYYASRSYPFLGTTTVPNAIATGTTAVVTTTAAHHYSVGQMVRLAGNTPAGYNGDWAITAVGGGAATEDAATTFSIYVGTALGAGTAFGTAQSASFGRAAVMRLGTGVTAVAKSGAGAAIVTYVAAITATKAFDATFPSRVDLGAGLGKQTQYKTTWAAGEATQNGLSEVVIGIDNKVADVAGTAAFTISRALLSPVVNKGASDTLAVTWNHKFLGA
jgi:hypothetical protein